MLEDARGMRPTGSKVPVGVGAGAGGGVDPSTITKTSTCQEATQTSRKGSIKKVGSKCLGLSFVS